MVAEPTVERVNPRAVPLLAGRARDQASLRDELTVVQAGNGRLVLLSGEAGIGKTSLARDLVRDACDKNVRVLAGNCYDLTNTPPYGPWIDLVAGYRPRDGDPATPPIFASGRLESVTDQAALFAEVRRFLEGLVAAGPTVVLLEDLHWADPASVELLRYVAPLLGEWPLLLLATYRADELTRRHPFYRQLPALVREGEGLRIDLRRLDVEGLRAMVSASYAVAPADERRLVDYLQQHAEGNPFFTTELLRALEEEGHLHRAGDGWALAELDRVVVPSLLRQVIDGRVARLGEETRHPLAVAAVIGQEVSLDLWAIVAGLDDDALLAIVEQAVEANLMEAERDGTRVRFVHALTREALYEGILPPRRRVLHRRVAELLAVEPRVAPDAVAYHFQASGDPRAVDWLERAGERAQRAYAWITAAERLLAASALLEHTDGEERRRGWLLYRASRLKRLSDLEGALAAIDEAERLAAASGDAVLVADLPYTRGVLLCYADRFRAGVEGFKVSVAAHLAIPPDQARIPAAVQAWMADSLPAATSVDTTWDDTGTALLLRLRLHFRSAAMVWFTATSGATREVTAIGEQIVGALADVPSARGVFRSAIGHSYHGLGIAYAAAGRAEASRQAFAMARESLAQLDHFGVIAFSLLSELHDVGLTYEAARPTVRRQLAAEAETALARAGGAFRPGLSPRLAWLACSIQDGRWDEADAILQNLPEPGNAYLRREITYARALIARYRGDPSTAWAQIAPLFPRGAATEPGNICHQEGLLLQRLAASLAIDAGDLPAAAAWLEAHDRWLAWAEGVLGCADGRLAWAKWHRAAGDSAQARAAATEALALASSPDQPPVRVGTHVFMGEVATAEGRFAEAENHLNAALGLATACEAPYERAQALLALADLRIATASEAGSLLAEARAICEPLGAAVLLARLDAHAPRNVTKLPASGNPAGLTEREIEVLRLVVRHYTDKEIADALFISSHTASTHVKHVLSKLGASGRREIAALAAQHGLV